MPAGQSSSRVAFGHGFFEMTGSSDRIRELTDRITRFAADREWREFHDPKNLAMAIASEAGELLSEFRWVSSTDADAFANRSENRKRIENEMADVLISLLLFCERTGIDPITAAEEKLRINALNYPVELSKGRSERPPQ